MSEEIIFKEITDKEAYLKKHYPFYPIPRLTDRKTCIHCGQNFTVKDFKVVAERDDFTGLLYELIVCPNAPDCDGTAIDRLLAEDHGLEVVQLTASEKKIMRHTFKRCFNSYFFFLSLSVMRLKFC